MYARKNKTSRPHSSLKCAGDNENVVLLKKSNLHPFHRLLHVLIGATQLPIPRLEERLVTVIHLLSKNSEILSKVAVLGDESALHKS